MCVFIMENYLFVCEENREKTRGILPREKKNLPQMWIFVAVYSP